MESTTISSVLGTALQGVSNDAVTMIQTVLPYGVAVLGGIILIGVGIRVFRRFTGR